MLYLLDKSVLARLENNERVRDQLLPLTGQLAICAVTLLELGWSATSSSHYAQMMDDVGWYEQLEITPDVMRLAVDLQARLVERGHHRGPQVPDLLIAAAAAHQGATVLHCDKHFGLIAEVEERLRHRALL